MDSGRDTVHIIITIIKSQWYKYKIGQEHTACCVRWSDNKAKHVNSPNVRSLFTVQSVAFKDWKLRLREGKSVKWRAEETKDIQAREMGDCERAQRLSLTIWNDVILKNLLWTEPKAGCEWKLLRMPAGIGGWIPASGSELTMSELGFRNQLRGVRVPSGEGCFPRIGCGPGSLLKLGDRIMTALLFLIS